MKEDRAGCPPHKDTKTEANDNMMHDVQMRHMEQANAIADPERATHLAVRSGVWSDPSIWSGNAVPAEEAFVVIPNHISVKYDVDSDVPLKTVRVDGALTWLTDAHTEMVVETIVTTPASVFEIGSEDRPVADHVHAIITFRDTPIDGITDYEQVSHGLVAYGKVAMQGAMKRSYAMLAGSANRGDRTIGAMESLEHWAVGDTVVVVGIGCGNPDEERTIAAIHEDQITFDRPLAYCHDLLKGMNVGTYVGNLTRNITLRSEDVDGVRGHVMLMNADNGTDGCANVIRFVAFENLGRTDMHIETGTMTNPMGRYPVHLFEMGTQDEAPLSILSGCAVNGSLGWGIVHHKSHAHISKNVVYDTVGAGIIASDGRETGEWTNNFVTVVDEIGTPTHAHVHPTVGASGFVSRNQLPEPGAAAAAIESLAEGRPPAPKGISMIEEFSIEEGDALDLIDVAHNFELNAAQMQQAILLTDVRGGVLISLCVDDEQHDLVVICGTTAAILDSKAPWVFEDVPIKLYDTTQTLLLKQTQVVGNSFTDAAEDIVFSSKRDNLIEENEDHCAYFGVATHDAFVFQESPQKADGAEHEDDTHSKLPVLELHPSQRSRPIHAKGPLHADDAVGDAADAHKISKADPQLS